MSSLELGTTAPVTNVYKLFWASFHQELGELAMEVMGADAMLARPGPHPFDPLQTMFMYSRAETIYGGSHQIQRNIVGERELGPAEGAMTHPPLDDVRVVDLSSGISGAYATKLLADAGAEVVKVERPAGDPFRAEAALFALLHTSKRNADARSGPGRRPRAPRGAGRRRRRRRHRSSPRARGVARVRRGDVAPAVPGRRGGLDLVVRWEWTVGGPPGDRVHAAGLVRLDRQPRPEARTAGRHRWPHRRVGRGHGRRRRRAGRAARGAPQRTRGVRRRVDVRGDDDRVQPVPGGGGAARRPRAGAGADRPLRRRAVGRADRRRLGRASRPTARRSSAPSRRWWATRNGPTIRSSAGSTAGASTTGCSGPRSPRSRPRTPPTRCCTWRVNGGSRSRRWAMARRCPASRRSWNARCSSSTPTGPWCSPACPTA